MKRLEKGDEYYFISIPYFKVCNTQDWHFGTDDERFKDGNYFVDSRDAKACFSEITEKFGEELDKLKSKAKKNEAVLIKAVRELSDKDKSAMNNTSPEQIVKLYVEATDNYEKTAREINKAISVIHEKIAVIIREAKK